MSAFPPIEGPRERREGIPGRPPPLDRDLPGCPFFERCSERMPGLCDTQKPRALEVAPEHQVACFLHDPSVPEAVKAQSGKEAVRDRVRPQA